jgi:hypothetical protein
MVEPELGLRNPARGFAMNYTPPTLAALVMRCAVSVRSQREVRLKFST